MVTLPEPFASIPRLALTFSTPPVIEPLDRLSSHLGRNAKSPVRLYVCREDMNSGLGGGGGNKLRKLEYGMPKRVSYSHHTQNFI